MTVGEIELRLSSIDQLFDSIDPTPFPDTDLDPEVAEFIESWAREHSADADLLLRIHLTGPSDPARVAGIAEAIHAHFDYEAGMKRRELHRLLGEGRRALAVGLTVLVSFSTLARLVVGGGSAWSDILREGLSIGGWVAMWRPMEIHLYAWWPIRRTERIYRRLAECRVEVVAPG